MKRRRLPLPERTYAYPRLSPDGTRIAVVSPRSGATTSGCWDIRLRRTRARDLQSWTGFRSPSGARMASRMIFSSGAFREASTCFEQAADGTGAVERAHRRPLTRHPASSRSPDGTRLVFIGNRTRPVGMNVMTAAARRQPEVDAAGAHARLASGTAEHVSGRTGGSRSTNQAHYESRTSGDDFPLLTAGDWQVSTGGGDAAALGSHDGRGAALPLDQAGSLMRVPRRSRVRRGPASGARRQLQVATAPAGDRLRCRARAPLRSSGSTAGGS